MTVQAISQLQQLLIQLNILCLAFYRKRFCPFFIKCNRTALRQAHIRPPTPYRAKTTKFFDQFPWNFI